MSIWKGANSWELPRHRTQVSEPVASVPGDRVLDRMTVVYTVVEVVESSAESAAFASSRGPTQHDEDGLISSLMVRIHITH